MKITLTDKWFMGYFQGWTITIDGIKYPRKPGFVYTAKSPLQALGDCFRYDREGRPQDELMKSLPKNGDPI